MIGNTPEYFQADNLILKNKEMINGKSIFNDMKPIQESDIVNLALDILRIFLEIHCDEGTEESKSKQRLICDIAESSNSFVSFADISIDCQRSNNKDLKDMLSAFGTVKDKDDFITRILVYGTSLHHKVGDDS